MLESFFFGNREATQLHDSVLLIPRDLPWQIYNAVFERLVEVEPFGSQRVFGGRRKILWLPLLGRYVVLFVVCIDACFRHLKNHLLRVQGQLFGRAEGHSGAAGVLVGLRRLCVSDFFLLTFFFRGRLLL